MDLQAQIESELHKIHRSRNRIGYIPNPFALLVSIYFQRDLLVIDSRWIGAVVCVILGTVIRSLVNEVFHKQWSAKVPWVRAINILGFIILGIGWGLHFSDIVYHYGAVSAHATYTLLIIAAFVTSSSTSLAANMGSYYSYVLTLVSGVILTYCAAPMTSLSVYIFLNILIFILFSISNHRIQHRQLCETLEARLKSESERERLSNIINTVPGFVGLFDRHGACYMANHTVMTFFPDVIGKKLGNLDQNGQWEEFILDFIGSDRSTDISEQATIFQGQEMHMILNVQKMNDGGAIAVAILMNELVEAKKIIRQQEAQAQYTAKLASLGEMAAGIAHEINNPLAIIQGSANIINKIVEQEPLDKVHLKIFAEKIFQTSERISKTIRSLKALSRNAEQDPKVPIELATIIEISIDLCEQRFKRADVQLILPEKTNIAIEGREVQLSQVLVNLLNNSFDAVKDLEERWVKVELKEAKDFVEIFVSDSGKGIPRELQEKIMEPFFTTKDVNQGTGLGLSISKTIISEHGGDLTLVRDTPHTTFRIKLPQKKLP